MNKESMAALIEKIAIVLAVAILFAHSFSLQAQINQLTEIFIESEMRPFATIPLIEMLNIYGKPVPSCHQQGQVKVLAFHSITSEYSLKQKATLEEIKQDFGEVVQISYASAPRYNVALDCNKNRNTVGYFDFSFEESQELLTLYQDVFQKYKEASKTGEKVVAGIPVLVFDCKLYRSGTLIPAEEKGYARIHSEKLDIEKTICSMLLSPRPKVCESIIEEIKEIST